MDWVLIIIATLIVTVFLLELWTVLRKINQPVAPSPSSLSFQVPPSHSTRVPLERAPTTTTITTTTVPMEGSVVGDTSGSKKKKNTPEEIKRNIRRIVDKFQIQHVNLDDMIALGRETAKEFDKTDLPLYEPYIADLMKEKCKSWPIMTKLSLYRHGRKAKEILLNEK